MGVYGPFNASLNTVVKVSGIDVNADRVFVENQSKYTLAIGFSPVQPAALQTLYGEPWYGEVPPGGKTVHIALGAYSEQFPGYFWVLAFDPLSATRAYTGAISSNTVFFVRSLVKGEPSPADYAIPQSADISSQPRVIALPISNGLAAGGAPQLYQGAATPPSAGTVSLTAATWSVLGQTNIVFIFYIHWFLLTFSADATGAGFMNAALNLDCQNAANVSLGGAFPIRILRDWLSWPAAAGPYPLWEYDAPIVIALSGVVPSAGSPDHFMLTFQTFSNSASIPSQLVYNCMAYPLFGPFVGSGGAAINPFQTADPRTIISGGI